MEVSISELAAARKDCYSEVSRAGHRFAEKRMNLVYAIEKIILRTPVKGAADAAEMRDKILYQFGEPDFADEFSAALAVKLLLAI